MSTELSASRSRSRPSAPACRWRTRPTPTFWQVSTEAEFLKGDVENLSIDGYGRLTLGPTDDARSTRPARRSSGRWSAAPDGSIVRRQRQRRPGLPIDPTGKGTVFFDAEELEVHALALAPGGGLYVGTSPDGKIYKVDAAGKASVFFDPPDKYIWSLAVDKAGNVFAATGDKGVVYKITPDGKGASFYQTKATHAMSLAFDARRPAARRHRVARPRVPARRERQAVRAARLAATTRSTRCAWTRRATSTPRRSADRGGAATPHAPPPRSPAPRRRSRRPSPTEITVDRGRGAVAARHGGATGVRSRTARAADRRPARVYRITARRRVGSDLGARARTRRTTSRSSRRQRARRHRQQGQDLSPRRRSACSRR